MPVVISLEEAARRTGLTKRRIGDLVAERKLTIERDPVTGERGIYPHTLRGVNGYQPPEPAPKPKPDAPPPPEPWTPSAAEIAALVRLDQPGRDAALAELMRRQPEAREYFLKNPLPPVFRTQEPPPPPEVKPPPPETHWKPPDPPPWRPETPSWVRPDPPAPKPETTRPDVPDPQTQPVSFGWLLMDALKVVLLAARKSAGSLLARAPRPAVRLAVIAALLVGAWLAVRSLIIPPYRPQPIIAPWPIPRTVRPQVRHHRAPPVAHHSPRPAAPPPVFYPLPSLRPPGADRPALQNPG